MAKIDRSRVTDIEEVSGRGILAKVDGVPVAAGNHKLMEQLGIDFIDCHSVGKSSTWQLTANTPGTL